MKKKTIIIISLLVVLVLTLGVGLFFWVAQNTEYQSVALKGYQLSVPKQWDVVTEENVLIFKVDEEEKGRFTLMYEDCDLAEIPAWFGYTAEELVVSESDNYATKVYEFSFKAEGEPIVQYVFDELPVAPPYKAVLTFVDISEKVAMKILSNVSLPDIESFAPEKPIDLLQGEALEEAVYTIRNDYGYFTYNIQKLEQYYAKDAEAEAGQTLHILAFEGSDEERVLKSWYCLVYDGEKYRLFTYYQAGNEQYIFDNAPKAIVEFKKEHSEAEDYSRYMADDVILLEGPYNKYSESKDDLLQFKGTKTEDSNSVQSLVMTALPAGIILEKVEIQSAREPKELILKYTATDADKYVSNGKLNEAPFYQNSLVLFSLIDDIDRVTVSVVSGGKTHTMSYNREKAEQQFENKDLREFANSSEGFTTFTEEVPNVEPPTVTGEGSGNKNEGTRVLKTETIVMRRGSKIKHPSRDEMISVEKYAEHFGVAKYLDKPITITLNEQVKNGVTTMYAIASCEGKHIGSYPIKTIDEFDALVALGR